MYYGIAELEDGTKFRFTEVMPHLQQVSYLKGTNRKTGRAVYTQLSTGEQFRCANQDREVAVLFACDTCGTLFEGEDFVHCDPCHEKEMKRCEESP